MKIVNLNIKSLYQLNNVELDFTYPKGHPKQGEILEKICFIGQSATGKTRILNLIRDLVGNLLDLEIVGKSLHSTWGEQKKLDANVTFKIEDQYFKLDNNQLEISNLDRTSKTIIEYLDRAEGSVSSINIGNRKNILLNFTSEILSKFNLNLFNNIPSDLQTDNSNSKTIVDFSDEFDENFIYSLLKLNIKHNKKYDIKIRELLESGLGQNPESLLSELEKWNLENINPIDDISKKLSSVFNNLFIEIDKINVKNTISFKDKRTSKSIPIENLSTGTKSLFLYLIPLFLLQPKDAIIIFDEPERSLFPDIQMNLIDYFKEISGDSQIIVATHSPFIAASFEPEERFILHFDDNGNVKIKRGISPIGDDPNDILKSDFQLEYLMNKDGRNAYERYKKLKKELATENNKNKKDKILDELMEIGTAYKF